MIQLKCNFYELRAQWRDMSMPGKALGPGIRRIVFWGWISPLDMWALTRLWRCLNPSPPYLRAGACLPLILHCRHSGGLDYYRQKPQQPFLEVFLRVRVLDVAYEVCKMRYTYVKYIVKVSRDHETKADNKEEHTRVSLLDSCLTTWGLIRNQGFDLFESSWLFLLAVNLLNIYSEKYALRPHNLGFLEQAEETVV